MQIDITRTINLVIRVGILLLLVFGLLFALTWTNRVKCKSIPMWCDAYYMIRGKPDVLIVYGESGLGDPELLADTFRNPNIVGVYAQELRLDSVNQGNLQKYEIVIVTRAKNMSSEKVKMFMDYSNTGGNLVWTGDAGTESDNPSDFLLESERYIDSNSDARINPWARKHEGTQVMLNNVLSVDYMGNYCDLRECSRSNSYYAGNLEILERDNPLTYGFSSLQLEVFEGQDFAIVQPNSEGTSTTVMTIDFGANLIAGETNYGNHLPIIISNADTSLAGMKFGENVFYYAMPLEYFANPDLPAERRYPLVVRRLYYGIIYG